VNRFISACAAIVLSGGQTLAGPCTSEIAALEQHLSSRDAGAGPVLGTTSGTGAENQISEAGSSTRSTTEASHITNEVRTGGDSNDSKRVGPTGAVGEATAGAAASPQDVRLQQQGQPTQAQAAKNATSATPSGEDKLQKVMADLNRARELEGKNDNACMSAIADARKEMNSN
jgi:hypothetical protein